MKKIIVLLMLSLFLFACSNNDTIELKEQTHVNYPDNVTNRTDPIVNYSYKMTQSVYNEMIKLFWESYPNEMASCLETRVKNNSIEVYAIIPTTIIEATPRNVTYRCDSITNTTTNIHSHPSLNACHPSEKDKNNTRGLKVHFLMCLLENNEIKLVGYDTYKK